MGALQLYLASSHLENNFMAIFCIENLLSTLVVLMASIPFAIKGTTFKEIAQTQSEYLSSGLVAFGEYSSWYKGAGLTSLKTGMAARGLCYPLSVMLMFMLSRTTKGNILRSLGLILVILVNISGSADHSYGEFFDIFSGALYLVFYVVFSVSSDFITVCMTNRSGVPKFLLANSFYLWICSFLILIDSGIRYSDIYMFIGRNTYKSIVLVAISSLSKILGAFYIQKFGIVSYSTTKISNYIYFNILRSITGCEQVWSLEDTLFHLAIYFLILFFIDSDEGQERALGFGV